MTKQPHITIIGTGFGGLGMAIRLLHAKIGDVHLVEKAADVGGTWRDNKYPGCACDVPSHLYSFSFETRADWSRTFPARDEVFAYMRGLADKYQLRARTRFNCAIASISYDDSRQKWHLHTQGGEVLETDIVITATGQLNVPKVPHIKGQNKFKGRVFHSAQWDDTLALAGKRVGVIGNGPSAAQFIPEVAKEAAHLTVYQRSPCHVVPRNDTAYSGFRKFLFKYLPFYRRYYRGLIYWGLESTFYAFNSFGRTKILTRLLHRASGGLAKRAQDHFEAQVQDPLMRDVLRADYALGCKRMVISDDYYPALQQSNVAVETNPIAAITQDGITTKDGKSQPLDVIIYGTGFASTDFLSPMQISGAGGCDLNTAWREGAEAYLGITMPQFPNFFMLYGPNTNLGHNSIIFMLECQFDYITRALRHLKKSRAATMTLEEASMNRFMDFLKARLTSSVWARECDSWYKNEAGRITNNWPDFTYIYQQATKDFNPSDYKFK